MNVPVTLMEALISGTPTPNGTGGNAAVVGNCSLGTTCPPGDLSVVVYVEDTSDSGAGNDVFKIYFCTTSPILPPPTFTGGIGEQMMCAAAAGIFPASANFNGVELAGGIVGLGARTSSSSANGDSELQSRA